MAVPAIQSLRYLWVYSAADEWTLAWHDRLLKRRRALGYDIVGFCNTPVEIKRRWLPFDELDARWRNGDRALMRMYEELSRHAENRDVLILYNGANLHPEFVKWMSLFKVYTAGDDPESTEVLTKPIAPAFDIHLVNNIACLEMYKGWGLKHVHFWPLGSFATLDDVLDLTEENIADVSRRPVPAVFFGGYQQHRKARFDAITEAFPNAFCAGSGWPKGFLTWEEMWSTYRKAQIGWNFHNSIGPVNFRTYELPAYGVLQICDNKKYLSDLFEAGKEIIGFDTVKECIDATRYYLAHPQEQRDIAVAGWKRWRKDYHPDRIWERLVGIVEGEYGKFKQLEHNVPDVQKKLIRQKRLTTPRRLYSSIRNISGRAVRRVARFARWGSA
jgi:hypothetical protein